MFDNTRQVITVYIPWQIPIEHLDKDEACVNFSNLKKNLGMASEKTPGHRSFRGIKSIEAKMFLRSYQF